MPAWSGHEPLLDQCHLWPTLGAAPDPSFIEGKLRPCSGSRQNVLLKHTYTLRNILNLGVSSPLPSPPATDAIIQPAALEDLEILLLAAASRHGDIIGQVSPDLTAPRYGGGWARAGVGPPGPIPEAASLPSLPLSSPLLTHSCTPPSPLPTGSAHVSCTGLGPLLGVLGLI